MPCCSCFAIHVFFCQVKIPVTVERYTGSLLAAEISGYWKIITSSDATVERIKTEGE